MSNRASTFSIAHTDLSAPPFNNAMRTVRITVPNNLCGSGIYLKFSNYYSKRPVWISHGSIALCERKGEIIKDTLRPITVFGDTSFAIVPQRDIYSDFIGFNVEAGQIIAVSLYYPLEDKVSSGNFIGNFAQRSLKGNFVNDETFAHAKLWTKISHSLMPWDASSGLTTLSSVIVQLNDGAPKPKVIAAFGDSVMQQGTWTTPFTLKLYQKYTGQVSFCNLGIGGNRLLHDSPEHVKGLYGKKGIERYIHDLLPIEGLTHVIFGLGTNDLGLPGKDGAPLDELITLQQYQEAVVGFVNELHGRGIKVFGCTLLPREIQGVYTAERENLRIAINTWIKEYAPFDAVLDFDAVVIDEKDFIGMKKEYVMPDGLHPNIAGGKALADSIDITLFD